ncbi:Uncharacterised protein [Shewanella putrefaciens]|nr:Uncharacterised protein [Shewanella putrefaciens]
MYSRDFSNRFGVHRHTGGLEILAVLVLHFNLVHRHTGGLERLYE